jgi:hypothetical protein
MTSRGQPAGTASDPTARPAADGTVELADAGTRINSPAEDSCGNDAPLEITERFPQSLGNLAQNARFPHSHSRVSDFDKHERPRHEPDAAPVPRFQRRC